MRLALLVALAACGPKPTPIDIPKLPGDGDKNVSKPTPGPTEAPDPWTGKQLIPPPQAATAPASIELPPIESYKLANGLQVHVIQSTRLPTTSVQLAVRAGRMHEPAARLGVAEITAEMLVKGTKRRDAAGILKAIDFVGGTIAADATFEATLMSCSVLSRNLGTCLELVPEMLTQPAFTEAELVNVKQRAMGKLRQRSEDGGILASAHVQNLLWGNDHVRGWATSRESINSITREDLVAWHKAWFVPANAMIVVSGDVDPKKLKGDLERTFGRWAKGPVPPAPAFKEPGLSGSRIRLVDKPGAPQTHIRIAQFGIKHDDPRFFDTLVWNYVLGGSSQSSRLVRAMRAEGRQTFGASSSFDRNLDKGSFVASTFTRPADAVPTAKVLLSEMARMAKEGPTQEEVSGAIANLAGGYGLRFQSAADVGASLLTAELHAFGREYLQNYPVQVSKVSVASAKQAAAEIIDTKAYVIILVGDAKDLEPQLKAAGWKYQKVAFSEPISPPVRVDTPIDPKAAAAATQLIEDALKAKGGKAKVAAIKGFRMLAVGTTTIPPNDVPVEIERLYIVPDKMRLDAKLTFPKAVVNVALAAAGNKGWQIAPDNQTGKPTLVEMQGPEIAQVDFERWREPELILLKALEPKAKIWAVADVDIDGKSHFAVKIQAPHGPELTLHFNKQSKLLVRMTFLEGGTLQIDDFSEFKEVNGVKIAHRRHSHGGKRTTKLDLKSVELDPKYDPKVFDVPKAP